MIHIIVGTRAQLIKMASIMRELQNRSMPYNFIFMAQHRETVDSMLDMFEIKKPDIVLGNMDYDITGVLQFAHWSVKVFFQSFFEGGSIFRHDKNGIVLIHGDAPPAILGAVVGKQNGFKVGYVEAGLRSNSLLNPFPEEIIRLLSSRFSDVFFCPGQDAFDNLAKYDGIKINTEGNTLYDSLQLALESSNKRKPDVPHGNYCLATIHRFENIFNRSRFKFILDILLKLSRKIKVLFILHPFTRENLKKFDFYALVENCKNIDLRSRYDYYDFVNLLVSAEFVITDGGSNQEECYYLGKPCLVLRKKTERIEGLKENVCLSELNVDKIRTFVEQYVQYKRNPVEIVESPAKKIVDFLVKSHLWDDTYVQ